jgi:hypothetical protein
MRQVHGIDEAWTAEDADETKLSWDAEDVVEAASDDRDARMQVASGSELADTTAVEEDMAPHVDDDSAVVGSNSSRWDSASGHGVVWARQEVLVGYMDQAWCGGCTTKPLG